MTENLSDEMKQELEELMKVAEEEIGEQMEAYASEVSDTHGDKEFAAWFLWMLSQYGPDWALALEAVDKETGEALVEGGKAILQRFNKITAEKAVLSGAHG